MIIIHLLPNMTKTISIAGLFFALCLSIAGFSQTYYYFQDSPDPDLYDYSWMEVTSPSQLERKGSDLRRFPVESQTPAHQGLNSLRLKWTSQSGGDWVAIAAGLNWTDKNISDTDTVSFWVFAQNGLNQEHFPKLFFEDVQNNKSVMIGINGYTQNLAAGIWTKIKMPMSPFINGANPVDFTKIKTIGFAQNATDGQEHTLYIDDMLVYKGDGTSPPVSVPDDLTVTAFQKHAFLRWTKSPETNVGGYEVYFSSDGGQNYSLKKVVPAEDNLCTDYMINLSPGTELRYKIRAFNEAGDPTAFTPEVIAESRALSDDELLDMVQEATFRYFWDFAHPVSGLARERNSSGDVVTSGGSGFGIMAICVGVHRNFITRVEGVERMLKIVNFLETADRFHGAWPHWLNGNTGDVVPFSAQDNGGDLVETAFLVEGLLAARQFFDQSNENENLLREKITTLWESVEWNWYTRGGQNVLYWHWSPNYGWAINMQIKGPNECMIVYLLAIASPTYPVSSSLYHSGWAGSSYYLNGRTFYGHKIFVGWDYGGPLFFTHYSFLGFDPRNIKDIYTNYFNNNRNISLIHRDYCVANPRNHTGYGANCWGLTASDDPNGYTVHEPTSGRDNGTITPTAALSAFPYTPDYSMDALKHFYLDLGNKTWGNYGFYDAFNQKLNWYATSYLAIDQGPIIGMIENHRSGLLWNRFMANPEIQPALSAMGFVTDPNSISPPDNDPFQAVIQPNPVTESTKLHLTLESQEIITVVLTDITGSVIGFPVKNERLAPGTYFFQLPLANLSKGVYLIRVETNSSSKNIKILNLE